MTTDQTNSLLWQWILQVAWWLAYMLPLAPAVILIALGIRWLHHRARDKSRQSLWRRDLAGL